MSIYTGTIRIPANSANVLLGAILRAALQAQSVAYMQAVEREDVGDMIRIMENIQYFQGELDLLVPRAGIEPALREETDFESAASTSSANGATDAEYTEEARKVKAGCPLCGEDCKSNGCPDSSASPTLPHSTQSSADDFPLRVANLLKHVDLPNGWKGKAGYYTNSDRLYLQVVDPNGRCNVTGAPEPWKGRKWALSEFMTDGEIINTVWKAVMTAAEHELREGFKFRGVTIFDPHYDPHALAEFMRTKGSRTWRDNGMTEVA